MSYEEHTHNYPSLAGQKHLPPVEYVTKVSILLIFVEEVTWQVIRMKGIANQSWLNTIPSGQE